MPYTGKCAGFEDDGSEMFLCVCDHVQDEHERVYPYKCEFCTYSEDDA
jgi:hypothetical protein